MFCGFSAFLVDEACTALDNVIMLYGAGDEWWRTHTIPSLRKCRLTSRKALAKQIFHFKINAYA